MTFIPCVVPVLQNGGSGSHGLLLGSKGSGTESLALYGLRSLGKGSLGQVDETREYKATLEQYFA